MKLFPIKSVERCCKS